MKALFKDWVRIRDPLPFHFKSDFNSITLNESNDHFNIKPLLKPLKV